MIQTFNKFLDSILFNLKTSIVKLVKFAVVIPFISQSKFLRLIKAADRQSNFDN